MVLNTVDTKTYTGSQIIINTLRNLGIDSIFGYPGGVVLSIYDELFKQNDIKHYLTRHEQAAVHAAEGYARVSGKCGVVLVTSGPGAANTVSGIANAYLDGYPLIILTGQVSKKLIGTDAFQEINIIEITKSCTKANYQVTEITTLEATLKEAYHCAMSGKKGPVVVDLSRDIFNEKTSSSPGIYYQKPHFEISQNLVFEIINEIKNSKRPVAVSGGGVVHSEACRELYKFVKTLNIPVVNTMMGTGTFPSYDKNYFGMIGIFGQNSANEVLKNSDLVISLGARFNDRITCCFKNGKPDAKFIQIDINENELSRVIPAHISVKGDIKEVLNAINTNLSDNDYTPLTQHIYWLEDSMGFKLSNKKNQAVSENMQSYEVIEAIYDFTKSFEPVVTTEVGQHQMWTVQNYKFRSAKKFITSGGSGTMGFGFPAAIGASIALNKQPVICIAGDGSFQMNEQELATCVDYKLPVKIFIMNNGYLGMVRQLQENHCEGRFSETKISNPDFVKLAQAYGIKAARVQDKSEIKEALAKAFSVNEPYLIDFVIEPMEIV